MQSDARTVAEYLKELPEPRRKTLTTLRALCRRILVDFNEGMEYGMPYYKHENGSAVGIASQKNYVSIYGLRKQAVETGVTLVGASVGKGCIRFAKPETMDFGAIETLLAAKRDASA